MSTETTSPIATYFRVCDGVRVRFADTKSDSDTTILLLRQLHPGCRQHRFNNRLTLVPTLRLDSRLCHPALHRPRSGAAECLYDLQQQ